MFYFFVLVLTGVAFSRKHCICGAGFCASLDSVSYSTMLGHDHGVDTRMLYSPDGRSNNEVVFKATKECFARRL